MQVKIPRLLGKIPKSQVDIPNPKILGGIPMSGDTGRSTLLDYDGSRATVNVHNQLYELKHQLSMLLIRPQFDVN